MRTEHTGPVTGGTGEVMRGVGFEICRQVFPRLLPWSPVFEL